MKIKTLEKLEDKLDADLAWRKKELFDLKRIIISSRKNRNIYIRAGIALLSAHFEGFIKTAANLYVIYVSSQKVPFISVKNSFVSLKLKKKLAECAKTEKTSVHTTLFDKFEELTGGNFSISEENVIDTESNPSSSVVEEILRSIGLDFAEFETKRHYIDYNLLSKRHEIVHGEKTTLNIDDFLETYTQILETIDLFKKVIVEAADGKKFLKTS